MAYVLPFRELDLSCVPEVGGKNASLGELLRELGPEGIPVPDGFAISANAFRLHLQSNGLGDPIYGELDGLDVQNVPLLQRVAQGIRERIRSAPLPLELQAEVLLAYRGLSRCFGEDSVARLTPVRIGHRGETEAEVLSGLDAGASVAVHPGDRVKDGARVEPR